MSKRFRNGFDICAGFLRSEKADARILVKAAWGKHAPLTAAKHQRYMAKFLNPAERMGTVAFLKALLDDAEPSWQLHRRFANHETHPMQLVWAEADVINLATADRWQALVPACKVTRLAQVGHFVADEAPELLAPVLAGFWSKN